MWRRRGRHRRGALAKLKSNTTALAKCSPSGRRMVLALREDPDGSNERCHRRSNVESAISAKKRKFASRVRGRSPTSQRLEEGLSWVGYNCPEQYPF